MGQESNSNGREEQFECFFPRELYVPHLLQTNQGVESNSEVARAD